MGVPGLFRIMEKHQTETRAAAGRYARGYAGVAGEWCSHYMLNLVTLHAPVLPHQELKRASGNAESRRLGPALSLRVSRILFAAYGLLGLVSYNLIVAICARIKYCMPVADISRIVNRGCRHSFRVEKA